MKNNVTELYHNARRKYFIVVAEELAQRLRDLGERNYECLGVADAAQQFGARAFTTGSDGRLGLIFSKVNEALFKPRNKFGFNSPRHASTQEILDASTKDTWMKRFSDVVKCDPVRFSFHFEHRGTKQVVNANIVCGFGMPTCDVVGNDTVLGIYVPDVEAATQDLVKQYQNVTVNTVTIPNYTAVDPGLWGVDSKVFKAILSRRWTPYNFTLVPQDGTTAQLLHLPEFVEFPFNLTVDVSALSEDDRVRVAQIELRKAVEFYALNGHAIPDALPAAVNSFQVSIW